MATDKPTRSSGRRDLLGSVESSSDVGPSSTRSPEVHTSTVSNVRPFISAAADEIALAALRDRKDLPEHCDLCDAPLGENACSGLLMWSRGDDRHFEEPPLCASCAAAIGVTAWVRWTQGEDEYE